VEGPLQLDLGARFARVKTRVLTVADWNQKLKTSIQFTTACHFCGSRSRHV